MLFTTPTQYIALAVALVAGWLFGLASHPGGKKWKARYVAERDAHAATSKRVIELERENHRLATERPVVEERPVVAERVVHDEPSVLGDRVVGDRIVAQNAARPAHSTDRDMV